MPVALPESGLTFASCGKIGKKSDDLDRLPTSTSRLSRNYIRMDPLLSDSQMPAIDR